jgi:hypothetical protein
MIASFNQDLLSPDLLNSNPTLRNLMKSDQEKCEDKYELSELVQTAFAL